MPRLEGMKSNTGLSMFLLLVLAVVLLWALEYSGIIDIINGYGGTLGF